MSSSTATSSTHVVLTRTTAVESDETIEEFGPQSVLPRRLFGNRLKWAGRVVREGIERRRQHR